MSNDFLPLDSHSRRSFVERCARAAFGLSILPFLEGARSLGLDTAQSSAMSPSRPGFGTAKHIIFLQLTGGMSHIDTFDPKTGASKSPKGAISTKAGFQLTEYLPKTADIADKITVVRSMTAKVGVHAAAQYVIRTGYEQRGTIKHPNLGAWAQHYLGPSHKTLPSSVCVNRNSDHGNGFFPATYSPLPILDPDSGLQNAVAAAGNDVVEKRLQLVNEIDKSFRERFPDENVKAYNDFYDNTVQLMKSSDLKAFDLNGESASLREAYGKSKFGQGCLLARRLVESGVRFIEVVGGGWDMHTGLAERMTEVGGEFDRKWPRPLSESLLHRARRRGDQARLRPWRHRRSGRRTHRKRHDRWQLPRHHRLGRRPADRSSRRRAQWPPLHHRKQKRPRPRSLRLALFHLPFSIPESLRGRNGGCSGLVPMFDMGTHLVTKLNFVHISPPAQTWEMRSASFGASLQLYSL